MNIDVYDILEMEATWLLRCQRKMLNSSLIENTSMLVAYICAVAAYQFYKLPFPYFRLLMNFIVCKDNADVN